MDVDGSSRSRQSTQNQQISLFHRQTHNNQWQTNQQNLKSNVYSSHGLAHKRPTNSSARHTRPKHQKKNNLALENDQSNENDDEKPTVADEEIEDIDDDFVEYDEIHFLGITPQIFYKPGKDNYVADALSPQHIHSLEDAQSDISTVGAGPFFPKKEIDRGFASYFTFYSRLT